MWRANNRISKPAANLSARRVGLLRMRWLLYSLSLGFGQRYGERLKRPRAAAFSSSRGGAGVRAARTSARASTHIKQDTLVHRRMYARVRVRGETCFRGFFLPHPHGRSSAPSLAFAFHLECHWPRGRALAPSREGSSFCFLFSLSPNCLKLKV